MVLCDTLGQVLSVGVVLACLRSDINTLCSDWIKQENVRQRYFVLHLSSLVPSPHAPLGKKQSGERR